MATNQKSPDEILLQAIKITEPAEQQKYLDVACKGNESLRAEVESLLKAYAKSGDFLEIPAIDPNITVLAIPLTEKPGTIIGRYKLLEKIGEGGMAYVYMAEQERPVRRKVALKIVKLGMDTKAVVARFEAERQALALMDHPNIARVFDGGATKTGRPYFVMELVRGIAITDYCDKNNLNTKQRLELFIQVCDAVQHAHQKGIIHRDIKPSNVLVTLRDGTPVPKIIDFGIAKATSQRLTEKTVFTRFAQMIGTPEYMSPEQAEMSELDIDTRTDVYSLGVLLYELLTGATPFDTKQLRQAGYSGIQRIIRETEPIKPSTKLSTLGQTLVAIALHRQTTPETLPKLIRGDLDWIVMRTLEKDRTHRYETAHALGEDIKRHLKHEPITAGRPGALLRCRKFVRRHRALVTGAAAVLIVLCVGIVISTRFAIGEARAYRKLRQAWEEVTKLENDRRLTTAQRLYADGHYQEALTEIESYMERGDATAEAHLIHARSLFALNKLEDAARELENLRAETESTEIKGAVHQLLAIIYSTQNPASAEEHRRLGESLLPKTAEACCLNAMVAKTLVESVQWLSQALDLDPSYYPARKARALAYYGLKDFEKMEQDADALIVVRPKDSLGYALRAIIRRKKGLLSEAIEDHERAIRFCDVTSRLVEHYDQRRATFIRAGDYLAALRDAKRCEELDPSRLDYQFNLFAALVSLKDYEAATEKWNSIIDTNPGYQKELTERAQKYVFNILGAGGELELPEEILSKPVFSAMQEAVESYRSLSAKATRLLPIMSARMSWSPDSRYLAYGRSDKYVSDLGMRSTPAEFLSSGIEILDLESGDSRLLVSFGKDPAWSPDGEYIAFVRGPIEYGGTMEEIWIVPAKGGEPRQIAMGGYPYWTADSRRVIFQSREDNTLCSVNIIDPNAEPEVIIECPDWYPAISTDGRCVAYYLNHELSIIDMSSASVFIKCSTPVPSVGYMMNWSPDSKELSLGGSDIGLWIFDVELKEIRQVINAPVEQGVWSPDRSRMGFRVAPPYQEIWLATLDPNKTTCESLAPVLTWTDYVRSQCERYKRLVKRCPIEAERRLAELTAFGANQYQLGQYKDTVMALTAVDQIRRTILQGESRAAEAALLAKALYLLDRRNEADACLHRLRQLFRQGKLIHGQSYVFDTEKTMASRDDRLSRLWHNLEVGQLDNVKQTLTALRSENSKNVRMNERLDAIRWALAMEYYYRARRAVIDSNAISDYKAAIEADPNYTLAFSDLACLQMTSSDPMLRDPDEAVENITRACELTRYENHSFLATLAAIHAITGDFNTAQQWQQRAITLLNDTEEHIWKDHYLNSLRQYQSQQYDEGSLTWEPCMDNLVARWTFDEGQGPVAHDMKGANHGTLHGDPVWTTGRIGGALQFDGKGDYVDCGNASVFDITDEITVASWIKVTAFDVPVQAVVTKGDSAWGLQRMGSGSSLGLHCNLGSRSPLTVNGIKPVDDGQWHYVAAVFDGSEGRLYIDGVLDVVTPTTSGSINTNNFPVWIGDNSEAPGNDWCGLIDDVRVYNVALSAKDLAALAQANWTTMSQPSGLVSYWPGDGNARDVVGVNHAVSRGTEDLKFAPGKLGQAFHFTGGQLGIAGTTGIADLQQFTMSLWVCLDSLPQGESASFLCLGREKAVLRCDDGPLHFYTRNAKNDYHHIRTNDALVKGIFHHVAGTYDGHAMRLYLDGAEVGTCLAVGTLTTEADNGVEFGRDNLEGLLDEIQIYNRPLSASEIRNLAQRAKVAMPTSSDPVAQVPLDSDMVGFVIAPAVGIGDLQQFSIALWVKLDSMKPDQIQRFVILGDKAMLRYAGGINTRQLQFFMKMTDGNMSEILADDVLNTGVFHHVVGTYDGHAMRLFLDGAQVGMCTPPGLSVHTNAICLSSGDKEGLCGLLDEVQIYDWALDEHEIQELHSSSNATLSIGGKSPIAWWRFDETSGTTAYDSVGSNHGTVQGAIWTDGKIGVALRFDGGDNATEK